MSVQPAFPSSLSSSTQDVLSPQLELLPVDDGFNLVLLRIASVRMRREIFGVKIQTFTTFVTRTRCCD